METVLTTVSTAVILAAVTAIGLYVIRLIDGGRLAAELADLAAEVRELRRDQAALVETNAALRSRLAALEAELRRRGTGGSDETRFTGQSGPD